MKAIGYCAPGSVEVLVDIELPKPAPGLRDLLVEVRAISINPVDAKIRAGSGPGSPGGETKVLGWDAAGIVVDVGTKATRFVPGDEVYYAGSVDRAGSYAEFHLVDERIVGRKPTKIGFAQAAALPLTTLTAWEMLFDRLKIRIDKPADAGSLLVLGGAGRRRVDRDPTCPPIDRAHCCYDGFPPRIPSLVPRDGRSPCDRSSPTDL